MLKLCARLLHQRELRQSGVEQGGLLGNFETAGDASVVPVIDKIESLTLIADRFLHHLELGVQLTQREVVSSELGGEHQLYILQIGSCGLQRGVCGFNVTAHPAEEIGLVAY